MNETIIYILKTVFQLNLHLYYINPEFLETNFWTLAKTSVDRQTLWRFQDSRFDQENGYYYKDRPIIHFYYLLLTSLFISILLLYHYV